MPWLPVPLRMFVLVVLIGLDVLMLRAYVAANHEFPFQLNRSTVQTLIETGALPTPTPAPPELLVELSLTDWQANILIGKIINDNSYAIYNTEIAVSLSPTKEPWTEEINHTFVIPTVINAGESLYFSKRLSARTGEFWWYTEIKSVAKHTDQPIDALPKDIKISTKNFPTVPTATRRPVTGLETPEPWGVARQIDEVTWTIRVQDDDRMATPQETLIALNEYRQRHSAEPLTWDDNLAAFARDRAKYLNSIKSTDKHAGFKDYVSNEDNVKKLGFWAVGENAGYGYKLIGVHQIEWIYAADEGHNKNQLDTSWSHVGIGIEGLAVVFIFGGSKI